MTRAAAVCNRLGTGIDRLPRTRKAASCKRLLGECMAGQGSTHRLGWLGTGRMGSELARRLLVARCDVAVYNRTRAKAEPLAAYGAKIANSAAELADRDIVFATVGTPQDLLDAV